MGIAHAASVEEVRIERLIVSILFFFQAEDGIRDLVRSRGLGDVYKRQQLKTGSSLRWSQFSIERTATREKVFVIHQGGYASVSYTHLTLPTIYSV